MGPRAQSQQTWVRVAVGPKFNDDLLGDQQDRDTVATLYPTICHVLDHSELRKLFQQYDGPANAAKKVSTSWGSVTIGLGSLALVGASLEVLLSTEGQAFLSQHPYWLPSIALAGVLCGVLSVVFGSVGVLSGRKKRNWLHLRLMTVSLRQFHFRSFIDFLPEIRASLQGERAKARFQELRDRRFSEFRSRIVGHLEGAMTELLNEEESEPQMAEAAAVTAVANDQPAIEPLFAAYRSLRFEHQIGYANFKLRDDHRIFSSAPRRQAAVLERFGFICIVLLLAIHLAVGAGILIDKFGGGPARGSKAAAGGAPTAKPADSATSGATPADSRLPVDALIRVLNASILWIAIAALAGRALEQGLHPERETEHYQQYKLACKALLKRFDESPSQADKVRVMADMERLAFKEMREFMVVNTRARFVM